MMRIYDGIPWSKIDLVANGVISGDVFLFKSVIQKSVIASVVGYLDRVKNSTLPEYQPFEFGCKNFCRLNDCDKRSYVSGRFWQMNFFPWNQDFFGFFDLFDDLMRFRNLVNSQDVDVGFSLSPDLDYFSRVGFQFYPSGGGFLAKHKDPSNEIQRALPLLIMSEKHKDFDHGGVFVELSGDVFYPEDHGAEPGDILLFDAQLPHGVSSIDPDTPRDWFSVKGRWMGFCPINRIASNPSFGDSVEL